MQTVETTTSSPNSTNALVVCRLFFERIFNRWTKWELYKSDEPYIKVTYCSPLLGNYEINRDNVLIDIYVKTNKFTGLKKYKRVVKYR